MKQTFAVVIYRKKIENELKSYSFLVLKISNI